MILIETIVSPSPYLLSHNLLEAPATYYSNIRVEQLPMLSSMKNVLEVWFLFWHKIKFFSLLYYFDLMIFIQDQNSHVLFHHLNEVCRISICTVLCKLKL